MQVVNSARFFNLDAVQACGAGGSDSDKIDCLRAAADKNFQAEAVRVCGRMNFGSNKAGCIKAVAEKMFLPAEIQACATGSDSDRIDCFSNAGRPLVVEPAPIPVPPQRDHHREHEEFILRELKAIQSDFQHGRVPAGIARLMSLVAKVEEELRRP